MEQQNIKSESNLNKHLNEINTRCDGKKEQIIESISNNFKEKINEMNKNLERKLNQIVNKKVNDSVKDMINNNNDKIVEVVELGNKILNSDDNYVSRGEKNEDIIKNVVLESKEMCIRDRSTNG